MQFITIASAALAALPLVSAGKATIYNQCEFDISAWSVSADHTSNAIRIKAGDSYSEDYQKPSSGGVSLKMMNNTDTNGPSGPISQFEYTLDSNIWYDMSNVDCGGPECPFAQWGWYLDSSDHSCPTRNCEGGLLKCAGAYIAYNDDWNTLSCAADKDIQIYMCQHNAPGTQSTPQQSTQEQKQPESTPEPTSVAVQQVTPAPAAAPSQVEKPAAVVTEVVTQVTWDMVTGKQKRDAPHRHHLRHPHARPMM